MTAPLTKKQLIFKINKEQGVDIKSLERMNVPALQKMDAAIPDSDDGDLLGDDASELPSGATASSEENTGGETVSDILGTVSGNTQEGTTGSEVGQSVPSQDGTDIVTPPESPSKEQTLSTEDAAKLPTESNPNAGAVGGAVDVSHQDDFGARIRINLPKGSVIGYHPVTEEPVTVDDQ